MHYLDTWWNAKRGTHGNIIFGRKGGFNQALTFLNSGKNVAILFDQNVKRSHSIFVNFFGIPASTTKTIGLASLKTDCKILFATMIKGNGGKYKLIVKWIKPPSEREGTIEERIHDTILDSHKILEETIRESPNLWFWIHRRFKTRPSGEAEDFYDKVKFPEDLS